MYNTFADTKYSTVNGVNEMNGTDEDSEDRPVALVAIDDSQQSQYAFDYYVTTLHSQHNELLLVHAAEPPSLPLGHSGDTKELWDKMIEEEQIRVKQLEDKYGVMMERRHLSGRILAVFSSKPGETICKLAERENCAMIVMGSRGLGMVRRTLLGSVSHYVLHHAHCPVVICRPP